MPVEKIYAVVGQAVRERRKRVAITQAELAQAVGLTRTSVNNLEHGRQRMMLHAIQAIAKELGATLRDLIPSDGATKLLARQRAETRRRVLAKRGLLRTLEAKAAALRKELAQP